MRRLPPPVVLGLLLAGIAAAGFVPWKVTVPAQRFCRFLGGRINGWQITLRQARWVPWRSLELDDLDLQTPQGGRLDLVRVHLRPQIWTLIRGGWQTRWEFEEIRLDPGSWGIRLPLAQEILSAGPVTTGGFAILELDLHQWVLRELLLHGPLLRLQAQGRLAGRTRQAELALKGELSRRLLEGMDFSGAGSPPLKPWEPFDLLVAGSLEAPEVRFTSRFLTFSMTPQWERKS